MDDGNEAMKGRRGRKNERKGSEGKDEEDRQGNGREGEERDVRILESIPFLLRKKLAEFRISNRDSFVRAHLHHRRQYQHLLLLYN